MTYDRSRPTRSATASCVTQGLDQLLVSARFLDRIQVFALNVFDERELEDLVVGNIYALRPALSVARLRCAARQRRSPAMSSNLVALRRSRAAAQRRSL